MTRRNTAFSLIELLVVLGIIGVLVGLLVPALSSARRQARITTCGVNERQIHIALASYSIDFKNRIPRGPDVPIVFLPTSTWADMGTKLIWVPYLGGVLNLPSPGVPIGLGVLIDGKYLTAPTALFCPGDTVTDVQGSLSIFLNHDQTIQAYGAYMYRQIDQTSGSPRLDNLGVDQAGIPASTLLFDQITEGFNGEWKDNHGQREANVLYNDGHVKLLSKCGDALVFRAVDGIDPSPVAAFTNLEKRMNQILVNADYALQDDASLAPQLP